MTSWSGTRTVFRISPATRTRSTCRLNGCPSRSSRAASITEARSNRLVAQSEASFAQLADEVLIERWCVEGGGPADLRPVVGLDFSQHLSPALRSGGDDAVIRTRALVQVKMARPEQRIHSGGVAASNDADIDRPRRVGNLAVEDDHSLAGQIVERVEVDQPFEEAPKTTHQRDAKQPHTEVRERRAEVRGTDGRQRGNAVADSKSRDGVARVEPTHAVSDEVHFFGWQGANGRRQPLGAEADRSDGRHARPMYLNSHRSQSFGDAAEVDVLPSRQPDLIEAQHAMGEHDR